MTPCIGVNVDVKGVEGMGGQARPGVGERASRTKCKAPTEPEEKH